MKTCPECAEHVQDAARICSHCGARLRPNYAAAVILLVLGLIAAAAFSDAGIDEGNDTTDLLNKIQRACEYGTLNCT